MPHIHFKSNKRREIGKFEWIVFLSYFSLDHNWFNRLRNLLHLIDLRYPEYWWMKRQYVFRRSNTTNILSDIIFKRVSISVISTPSIILEQVNSLTLMNALGINWIPSSVSDGMSNSNSVVNHHSPISLWLYHRDCYQLLWM